MSEQLNALARIAATGSDADFEALVKACQPMVNARIRGIGFRTPVLDTADLRQVCLLAIRESLSIWNPQKSSFSHFASYVMRRRLLEIIRLKKHRQRNDISIHAHISTNNGESTRQTVADIITDPSPGPADICEQRDEAAMILGRLSPRDRHIIESLVAGDTYAEIAQRLNITVKAIDNIKQRVRRRALQGRRGPHAN